MSAFRLSAAVLFLTVLALAPARADAVIDVLRAYGLLGTWASDCAAGASTSNWYVTYYVSQQGKGRRISERGPDQNTLDGTVDTAERLTATTLRMKLRNEDPNWGESDGIWYDVVVQVQNGATQSLSSIGSNGVQYIREGKFQNGNPAPVLYFCRGKKNS
jgi:hypothetical protein